MAYKYNNSNKTSVKYTDRRRKRFPTKKNKKYFIFNKIYFIIITIIVSLFLIGGFFSYISLQLQENKKFEKKCIEIEKSLDFIEKVSYIKIEEEKINKKIKKVALSYNKNLTEKDIEEITKTIVHMTYKYENLSLDLILAVITQESGWKYNAISPVGAIGIMQIMPATGEFLSLEEGLRNYSLDSLFNPITNIKLGCRYMNFLFSCYGENTKTALIHYNAGGKWASVYDKTGRIVPEETKNYIPNIERLINKFNVL